MTAIRSSAGSPDFTVAVSRTLRDLWSARQVPGGPLRAAESDGETGWPSQRRVRLRRDGARPLVFDGSVIVSRICPGVPAPQDLSGLELTLYKTAAGALVGAAAATFTDRGGNRPVHLAAEIAAPDDLDGLLDAFASALGEEIGAPDQGSVAAARRRVADLSTGLLNPSTATENENEVSNDLHD